MKRTAWKGGYIDGWGWWVMEEELWTAIVHWLWINTRGSCNMVGSSEVNCVWVENTLNSELWTLNPELWTLNPEPWTLNPGRGSMLEMLKIFWNGYHLLLQPLKDKVNYLWIDTAGNPLGIGISRALLMLRNWRQLWLRKKDSWLMVGNVVTIGREMDGWSDLGCGDWGGGISLKVSIL